MQWWYIPTLVYVWLWGMGTEGEGKNEIADNGNERFEESASGDQIGMCEKWRNKESIIKQEAVVIEVMKRRE